VYVKPKKQLGQHFLRNDDICQQISQSLIHPESFTQILEIGPGTGALTKHLLNWAEKELRVIEIDPESVAYLNAFFPSLRGKIIEKDILRLPIEEVMPGQVAVIGNFPFNISSQILFWMLDHKESIPQLVGMFQREVAKRITGGPVNKDYGILSVLVQAYYEAEYLFTVDEHEFDPPPKVKSGVIRLIRKTEQSLGCDPKLFKTVVKTAFNQRRKIMRNSLKSLIESKELLADDIFVKRPEQLSVAQFVDLTNRIAASRESKQ